MSHLEEFSKLAPHGPFQYQTARTTEGDVRSVVAEMQRSLSEEEDAHQVETSVFIAHEGCSGVLRTGINSRCEKVTRKRNPIRPCADVDIFMELCGDSCQRPLAVNLRPHSQATLTQTTCE